MRGVTFKDENSITAVVHFLAFRRCLRDVTEFQHGPWTGCAD
jgi:hypothetical protein